MVLELRQSNKYLRRILGSNLVGKGEIPRKAIIESPNMVFKEWVKIDFKEVKMLNKWDEYGCKNCHDYHPWLSKEDYDIFALGASLEAF
ncbi:hypothetical protein Lal_00022069 [Lupinus albus]|nr:hypothetical protein Lal_00022069 [Lupinus albus]